MGGCRIERHAEISALPENRPSVSVSVALHYSMHVCAPLPISLRVYSQILFSCRCIAISSLLNNRVIVGVFRVQFFALPCNNRPIYRVLCCRMEILNLPCYCRYIATYICAI